MLCPSRTSLALPKVTAGSGGPLTRSSARSCSRSTAITVASRACGSLAPGMRTHTIIVSPFSVFNALGMTWAAVATSVPSSMTNPVPAKTKGGLRSFWNVPTPTIEGFTRSTASGSPARVGADTGGQESQQGDGSAPRQADDAAAKRRHRGANARSPHGCAPIRGTDRPPTRHRDGCPCGTSA